MSGSTFRFTASDGDNGLLGDMVAQLESGESCTITFFGGSPDMYQIEYTKPITLGVNNMINPHFLPYITVVK